MQDVQEKIYVKKRAMERDEVAPLILPRLLQKIFLNKNL